MTEPRASYASISYANPTPASRVQSLMDRAGLDAITAAAELEVEWPTVLQWTGGTADVPRWALLALEALVERNSTLR
jgi:hypothetical protein